MKKLIALLICMVMTLMILPGLTVSGNIFMDYPPRNYNGLKTDDGFMYDVDESSGSVSIRGYSGDGTDIVIPAEIEGLPVTEICSSAFEVCMNLTNVRIPDSVTEIGSSAFEACTNLKNVSIPDSVTEIGSSAFSRCTSLINISIPDSVTEISSSVFSGCSSLTNISIPDSVTEIGVYAFGGCTGLTSVKLPDGLRRIEDVAFLGCCNLTDITIPDSVTYIGDHTFYDCASLTNITIPDGVTHIGDYAFSGCTGLANLEITDHITYIGYGAFYGCTGINRIDVSDANSMYVSVDGILFNKEMTRLIQYPAGKKETVYIIPNSVTVVDWYAFSGCSSLRSVTIPYGIVEIGERTFDGCTDLTTITIPASLGYIGSHAFDGCTGLTGIYYGGSKEDWGKIELNYSFNSPLIDAVVYYNYIPVLFKGSPITFDVPPMITDGTTMLPVRLALEPLGAEFVWNGEKQTVTIRAEGKTIVLTVGSDIALVDGKEVLMAKPAMAIDGRTLIPIRFVAEELGYDVDWNGETRTVIING